VAIKELDLTGGNGYSWGCVGSWGKTRERVKGGKVERWKGEAKAR